MTTVKKSKSISNTLLEKRRFWIMSFCYNSKLNANKWWKRGKVLGAGASAIVSEAWPIPDHPCSHLYPSLMAVKSSLDSLGLEEKMLSIFKNNPNIIQCYGNEIDKVPTDSGVDTPIYNIFLEYASDGCLADEIEKTNGGGGLPVKKIKEYLKGILLGLKEIHKAEVVHCDIKPENILIADGVPKIADFGMAMKQGTAFRNRGTPNYMAPEVIAHGVYFPAADIWSLGCTFVKMLTGKEVSGVSFGKELMNSIEVPKIPNELCVEGRDFLKRCLVRDHRRRWTAESLLAHPFIKPNYFMFFPTPF